MRLGAAPEPINQDVRNQILRDITAAREQKVQADRRAATVPKGRPVPFAADQAAYEAALQGFSQTDIAVRALENRLVSMPGPYWMDLTQPEKDALALWTQSIGDLDGITYRHYPAPAEVDVKKLILLAIGVGAIFSPLLFTKGDSGLPFSLLPEPPEIPFGRAPSRLPSPIRPESSALPYRQIERSEVMAPVIRSDASSLPSIMNRPGYTPPPRFTRGFSEASRGGSSPDLQRIPGNVMRRPEGAQRFIYPKPRSS